jgi:colanic acid biosynthesis glycosyl transferase WcaI
VCGEGRGHKPDGEGRTRAVKIVIVSQYYPPESVPLPSALAHGLAERGHDVRVLTAYPNYPDGRLAAGYRQRLVHHERDGDVLVRRVPIVISHSSNPLGRLANYVSFGLSSITASRFVRDADVVYVYATQMTAAIGPSVWRQVSGTPYVLHVQDLWPESITGSAMVGEGRVSRTISAVLTPWLRYLYRNAAATIGIGPSMARLLKERGAPSGRIHAVYNWAPVEPIANVSPIASSSAGDAKSGLRVMYAGNLGYMQDLETVIRAASLVRDLPGFRLTFFGSGVAEERLRTLARELRATSVEFVGRVPSDEMPLHHSQTDFQLVKLKNLAIFQATVPSKLQTSLASGTPVITTVAGDVTDLVQKHGVGLTSSPGNPEALAQAFRAAHALSKSARTQMGQRARALYEASMSASSGIDALEAILLDAARLSKRNGNNDRVVQR